MNRIYQHSCETMPELRDDRVALTVTSPPYWNAIDYDIHAANKAEHYRTRAYAQGYSDYTDYLDWLDRIFKEVLRVTKPGGFCAIVIGTVLLEWTALPGAVRSDRALHSIGLALSSGHHLAQVHGGRQTRRCHDPETVSGLLLSQHHDRVHPGLSQARRADLQRALDRGEGSIELPDQQTLHLRHRQQRLAHRARAARSDSITPARSQRRFRIASFNCTRTKANSILDPFTRLRPDDQSRQTPQTQIRRLRNDREVRATR